MKRLSKHFSTNTFKCHCKQCKQFPAPKIDFQLVLLAEQVREFAKQINPDAYVYIHPETYCQEVNRRTEYNSMSLSVRGVSHKRIFNYLCDLYPTSLGLGVYDGFIRIDVRNNRVRWNNEGADVINL
jgi:hypothetical protein